MIEDWAGREEGQQTMATRQATTHYASNLDRCETELPRLGIVSKGAPQKWTGRNTQRECGIAKRFGAKLPFAASKVERGKNEINGIRDAGALRAAREPDLPGHDDIRKRRVGVG